MSIKTTVLISRESAIERIKEILYESDLDISNWPNNLISSIMDEPHYRYSMFENYVIKDEDL